MSALRRIMKTVKGQGKTMKPSWVPTKSYSFLRIMVREELLKDIERVKRECGLRDDFYELLLFVGLVDYKRSYLRNELGLNW